ncbi:low molecular weight phosphotyrosine protein phosphatase [Streptomyces sp. NBC_01186]|uniref:low molecular weight protein-tyrosine-phosphatase n=1 Tax=Streptomyces sp. NBC_01186 TaxID=2903765 RepID=UPI002E1488D6|nr:low molecular weight phosphotyrosine protein phosphatase [Streptomyces sp. NBC_01186]
MYRVCFVCTGNICRSPMAEAVFRSHVRDAGLDHLVEIHSAGTGSWHLGDPADPRTSAVLEAAGYGLTHEARRFEPAWFQTDDLIVALDEGHARELRGLARRPEEAAKVRLLRSYDPEAVAAEEGGRGDLSVPDPYYSDESGFEECLDLVEAAMPGLLSEVAAAVEVREAG